MKTAVGSAPSDDWRDEEIHFLRGEIARLREEIHWLRRHDPMRHMELRERGLYGWGDD